MSRIIDKLRSKAYYAYEGFLDETINKATKFLASSTTKFITSTFTIELNYDLEDLSSDTVEYYGDFYTTCPEWGNHCSGLMETAIPVIRKPLL